MVDISEGIQFRRDGVDPSQWPKLSCSDANQLALEMSHLSLEADRAIVFWGNGQLKMGGDLRCFSGTPALETLTLLATGKIGIGEPNPTETLTVNGTLKLQQGVAVNQFSNDGTLGNNSSLSIPTEKAVKTYFETQLAIVNTTLTTAISQMMDKLSTIEQELQEKTNEISRINQELKESREALQNTLSELEKVKIRIDTTTETVNTSHSEISSLRQGLEQGSIVVQKAIMLQARNSDHWMRFSRTNTTNHDVFELWRTDTQWFSNICVDAASRLDHISFDGNKTIIDSPLTISIPYAEGDKIIPLEIRVGTFGNINDLQNSYYIFATDVGGGTSKSIKPG